MRGRGGRTCEKRPESRVRLLSGKWREGRDCFLPNEKDPFSSMTLSKIWTRNIGYSAQINPMSSHPDRAVLEMSPSAPHLAKLVER